MQLENICKSCTHYVFKTIFFVAIRMRFKSLLPGVALKKPLRRTDLVAEINYESVGEDWFNLLEKAGRNFYSCNHRANLAKEANGSFVQEHLMLWQPSACPNIFRFDTFIELTLSSYNWTHFWVQVCWQIFPLPFRSSVCNHILGLNSSHISKSTSYSNKRQTRMLSKDKNNQQRRAQNLWAP